MGVEHLRRAHERRGRQFESHRAERWPRSGDLTGVGARETKVGDEGLGLTDDPFLSLCAGKSLHSAAQQQ